MNKEPRKLKRFILIQGDVMLKRVKLPEDLKPAPEGAEILALGETSGHGHVAENCDIMIGADEAKYVIPRRGDTKKVKGFFTKEHEVKARLLHKHLTSDRPADHRELILPDIKRNEGFKVIIQNEYNAFKKIMTQVLD